MSQKLCKNGCGRWISWNNESHFFEEVNTGNRHKSANWNRISTNVTEQVGNERSYQEATLNEILNIVKRVERIVLGLKSEPTA
jgi:hypothetical protein